MKQNDYYNRLKEQEKKKKGHYQDIAVWATIALVGGTFALGPIGFILAIIALVYAIVKDKDNAIYGVGIFILLILALIILFFTFI